tara:strand:+ start:2233 stop:2631 length:399 start_codon:yes stop_codon:yes gene_type:complete
MLLIDIDYFKKFNDTYGHIAGDDALRSVAKAISSSIHRPTDFVARYGGEEFVVLLPNTDLAGAEYVAKVIFKSIAALKVPHAGSEYGYITLSAGLVSVSGSEVMRVNMLELADKYLYEAKEGGRNRYKKYQG